VAVARERDVGVDVERIDARRDGLALAERALDADGAAAVRAAPAADRAAVFHQRWVRREAVAKCAGTGLSIPPPDTPRQVIDLDVGEGYAAALAVAGAAPVWVELRP
jgi:phosphopantetheinyl transferase